MLTYENIILVLVITTTLFQSSHTQILENIFDSATGKIADKISDGINDAIYRDIEKTTIRAVDDATDEMLRERYQSDSISRSRCSADYSGFLKAFITPVDLHANYTFDMVIQADTKDYDRKNQK